MGVREDAGLIKPVTGVIFLSFCLFSHVSLTPDAPAINRILNVMEIPTDIL